MDKPEQLGSTHECLSDLLHAIGGLELIAIACAAAGIPAREVVTVCYRNPRIQVVGLSKAARSYTVDLVYTVQVGDRVVELWIIEIDLSLARVKRRRWALYLSAFENEYDADGQLAVFAPDPELREKIRTRVIPRARVKPLLILPDHIERITDYADARRRPRLAILGCLFHAHDPAPPADQVAVFRAATIAMQTLPPHEAQRYHVLVMAIVSKTVVDQGLEQLRASGELDEDMWAMEADTVRKGYAFAVGREEGVEAGLEAGLEAGQRDMLRRAVVDMLEVRGFALSPQQRERIAACESVDVLERWYAAAKVAAANQPLDQLLDDGEQG